MPSGTFFLCWWDRRPRKRRSLEAKISHYARFWAQNRENQMGGVRKGAVSNNRFVLKPDFAITSEVSILSKNSLAITDFHAKKTQHVQLFENPLPGTPPFAIPNKMQEKQLRETFRKVRRFWFLCIIGRLSQ